MHYGTGHPQVSSLILFAIHYEVMGYYCPFVKLIIIHILQLINIQIQLHIYTYCE